MMSTSFCATRASKDCARGFRLVMLLWMVHAAPGVPAGEAIPTR